MEELIDRRAHDVGGLEWYEGVVDLKVVDTASSALATDVGSTAQAPARKAKHRWTAQLLIQAFKMWAEPVRRSDVGGWSTGPRGRERCKTKRLDAVALQQRSQ